VTSLDGARVLLTGAAGVVGSTLVDQLTALDLREIVVLDDFSRGSAANLTAASAHDVVRVVEGDVRDRKLVEELTRGTDVVFHLAAMRLPHCVEEPRLALEVMVDGTFNVVDAARDAGVRRVVASSSASVYGAAEQFPIDETHHHYGNRTLYGAAKVFLEGLLRSYHDAYGVDYVALRYFNVYGPRMDAHSAYVEVLVRWMQRIDDGLPPVIHGDGSMTMDFVEVSDIARANVLAAESDVTDVALNIGTGTETSLLELAQALLVAMGSDLELEYAPPRAIAAVPRRLAATQRAADTIGFRAEIGLEEGLRRLVEWWRTSGSGRAASSS
jgi:UDP-glucose 4-epimerase